MAALHPKPSGGFYALPRELRDMICKQIASDAGIRVNLYDHYSLEIADKEFVGCLKMLYEWSPRSSMAQAVYEEILSGAQFIRQWVLEPGSIVCSTMPLIMGSYGPMDGMEVSPRSTVDLRYCVRDIELDIKYYRLNDSAEKPRDLSSVKLGLTQLSQLPNLRRVRLIVWILAYTDAYHGPMRLFGSISSAIKQLKKRVGDNFSISIQRPFLDNPTIFFGSYDINWMWDPPSRASEENAKTSLTAVEERIKRLITDGVDPNKAYWLVDELRAAACQLPEHKDAIMKVDDWSVGSGITKEMWLETRRTWRRRR